MVAEQLLPNFQTISFFSASVCNGIFKVTIPHLYLPIPTDTPVLRGVVVRAENAEHAKRLAFEASKAEGSYENSPWKNSLVEQITSAGTPEVLLEDYK